jgi:hypothetical protein
VVLGAGLVAGYQFARHHLNLPAADSRTAGLTTRVACGLHLVTALEAGGLAPTLHAGRRHVRGEGHPLHGCLLIPGTRSLSG